MIIENLLGFTLGLQNGTRFLGLYSYSNKKKPAGLQNYFFGGSTCFILKHSPLTTFVEVMRKVDLLIKFDRINF